MRRFKPDKQQVQWALTALSVVLGIFILYYLFFNGKQIRDGISQLMHSLMAVQFGILIAYLSSPVLNFIERFILAPIYKKFKIDVWKDRKKKKQMRKISVFLTLGFIIFILYAVIALIVPQLVNSIVTIVKNVPIYGDNITKFVNRTLENNPEMAGTIGNTIDQGVLQFQKYYAANIEPKMADIIQTVGLSVYQIIVGIFNFFVGLIVSIYLLYSKEHFCSIGKKLCYATFTEKWANEIVGLCRYIHQTFIGFFTGKILDSAIIGVICWIGCRMIGTPFPVLMAFIIGVTNLIPFFGPIFGAIIGSIIVFMVDPLQSLFFLIFAIALQQFDGNILGPKILGDSTGLSSFWVIFAIMFFGAIWGIPGWILGVPMFAVFYAMARRLVDHMLKKKGLPYKAEEVDDLAYIENGQIKRLSDPTAKKYFARRSKSSWAKLFKIQTKAEKNEAREAQNNNK